MMITLAWLTVSLPFVYAAKQTIEQNMATDAENPSNDNREDNEDPFANTTEEKTSNNITVSEEYLHDNHSSEHYLDVLSREYIIEQASTYIAFYGKLISPPPDAA